MQITCCSCQFVNELSERGIKEGDLDWDLVKDFIKIGFECGECGKPLEVKFNLKRGKVRVKKC